MARFLFHFAQVHPSADLKLMGWVTDDTLQIVVGFSGFVGKICQAHVAMRPGFRFSPKQMLRAVFEYAFNDAKREMVIGLVNSANNAAMIYDRRLGFRELLRLPGMHDDGGDLVVFGLRKDECRFILQPVTSDALLSDAA